MYIVYEKCTEAMVGAFVMLFMFHWTGSLCCTLAFRLAQGVRVDKGTWEGELGRSRKSDSCTMPVVSYPSGQLIRLPPTDYN